jgi:DNA polymerase III epsilon subunit-like protein
MREVVVFDCEHLTNETSPSRFWCGPDDPDPLLVQIGAVRLSLEAPFALGESFDCIVAPVGRDGPLTPSDFFTRLTGIDAARIAREGLPLAEALERFAAFAGDAPLWSWGKDEITSIAPACFVAGIVSPIPAGRFGNAAALLLAAEVPLETIHGLRSHRIAAHFGLPPEPQAHDGLADARAVARVLAHLLAEGRLAASDVARTGD